MADQVASSSSSSSRHAIPPEDDYQALIEPISRANTPTRTKGQPYPIRPSSSLSQGRSSPNPHTAVAGGRRGSTVRAPTPIDGKVFNLPGDYDVAERVRDECQADGQGKGERDEGDGSTEQGSRQSKDKLVKEVAALLPHRDEDNAALAAIVRLEKMQKQKDSKKWWMRKTGMFVFVKEKATRGHRPIGELDDSARASSSNLVTPTEVRLGIQSVPDFPVLAFKKGAMKASRLARAASPGSEDVEEENLTDGQTSAASRARQTSYGSIGARLQALNPSMKRPARRPSDSRPSSSASAIGHPLEPNWTRTSGEDEAGPSKLTEPSSNASRRLSDVTTAAAGPSQELHAVTEEPPEEEEIGGLQRSGANRQDSHRMSMKVPTLHVQEASQQSIEEEDEPLSSTQPSRTGTIQSIKPVPQRRALSLSVEPPREEDHTPGSRSSRSNSNSFFNEGVFDEPGGIDEAATSVRQVTADPPTSTDRYDSPSSSDDREDELQRLDEEGSADSGPDDTQLASLSLQHGTSMSNKQLRKQLKRDNVLPMDGYGAKAARAASLGHKVSRGLHYASTESRNRRAMEKYSPAPAKALNQAVSRPTTPTTGNEDLSMSRLASSFSMSDNFTSAAAAGYEGGLGTSLIPTRSSRMTPRSQGPSSVTSSNRPSFDQDPMPSSPGSRPVSPARQPDVPGTPMSTAPPPVAAGRRGSLAGSITSPTSGSDRHAFHLPTRWGTHRSDLNTHLQAPRAWHFRQRRRWAKGLVNEGSPGEEGAPLAGDAAVEEEDPERELDRMLGKLALEQAPEQAKEQYEWDVLHENQRGLLFFGIPKFSAKVLMQWDPSSWTDRKFQNSPYSIVNAQLPDPSWEWIYPEWVIDMSGDVDESGWQYSGNFGSGALSRLNAFIRPVPKGGTVAKVEMSDRIQKRQAKRTQRERTREDDGLEALKRSIKARGSKWTGRPDGGSFVRRRRWIRLRRRNALSETAQQQQRQSVGQRPKASQEGVAKVSIAPGPSPRLQRDSREEGKVSDLSSSSSDSDSSADLLDESDEVTSDGDSESEDDVPQRPNGRLPRKSQPKHSQSRLGGDPRQIRLTNNEARELARHRKELTKTLRDLKHLLPAVLDGSRLHGASGRSGPSAREKVLGEIDACNPFISWKFVKSRLADDDMGWKTTSLRQRERRYQTRKNQTPLTSAISPTAGRHQPNGMLEGSRAGPRRQSTTLQDTYGGDMFAAIDAYELTRDALVEINWMRVKKVLRACRLDRQRLDLWRLWLGLDTSLLNNTGSHSNNSKINVNEQPAREDAMTPVTGRQGSIQSTAEALQSPRSVYKRGGNGQTLVPVGVQPDLNDVWDVLERRLDSILVNFEFNHTRAELLRILLACHDTSHPHHRDPSEPWQVGNTNSRVQAPRTLDPTAGGHYSMDHLPNGSGHKASPKDWIRFAGEILASPSGEQDWIAGLAARLQFYSDVIEIAESLDPLPENGRPAEIVDAGQLGSGTAASSEFTVRPTPMQPVLAHFQHSFAPRNGSEKEQQQSSDRPASAGSSRPFLFQLDTSGKSSYDAASQRPASTGPRASSSVDHPKQSSQDSSIISSQVEQQKRRTHSQDLGFTSSNDSKLSASGRQRRGVQRSSTFSPPPVRGPSPVGATGDVLHPIARPKSRLSAVRNASYLQNGGETTAKEGDDEVAEAQGASPPKQSIKEVAEEIDPLQVWNPTSEEQRAGLRGLLEKDEGS